MTQTAVFDAQATPNTVITQLTAPTFTTNVWESSWVDVTAFRRLTLILAMNQASATNGVVLEQSGAAAPSADADAWVWSAWSSTSARHPVNASVTYHQVGASVERIGTYARLVVKSAGTDPTTFLCKVIGCGIT